MSSSSQQKILYIHARFIRNKIDDIGRFKVSNIIFPYHISKIDSCISRHVCSSAQCHVTQIAQCRVHCQLPSIAKIWEWFLILSGFGGIWCNIAHNTSLRSDIELMIDTLYLTRKGELWGTHCHCLEEIDRLRTGSHSTNELLLMVISLFGPTINNIKGGSVLSSRVIRSIAYHYGGYSAKRALPAMLTHGR